MVIGAVNLQVYRKRRLARLKKAHGVAQDAEHDTPHCLVMQVDEGGDKDSAHAVHQAPATIELLSRRRGIYSQATFRCPVATLAIHLGVFGNASTSTTRHYFTTLVFPSALTSRMPSGRYRELRHVPLEFMQDHPRPPYVGGTQQSSLINYFRPYADAPRFSKYRDAFEESPDSLNSIRVCTAPLRGDIYAPTLRMWMEYNRLAASSGVADARLSLSVYDYAGGEKTRELLRQTAEREDMDIHIHPWTMPGSRGGEGLNWRTQLQRHALRTRMTEDGRVHRVVNDDIEPWVLPDSMHSLLVHYFGQIAAIQDCLMRSVGRHRWVAVVDFDEYIVGRGTAEVGITPWTDLIREEITAMQEVAGESDAVPLLSGLGFRNVFYCGDCLPATYEHAVGPDPQSPLACYLNGTVCGETPTTIDSRCLYGYRENTENSMDASPLATTTLPFPFYATVRQRDAFPNSIRSKFMVDPLLTYHMLIHSPGSSMARRLRYGKLLDDAERKEAATIGAWLGQFVRDASAVQDLLHLLQASIRPRRVRHVYVDPTRALLHHYRTPAAFIPAYTEVLRNTSSTFAPVVRALFGDCPRCKRGAHTPMVADYTFVNNVAPVLLAQLMKTCQP